VVCPAQETDYLIPIPTLLGKTAIGSSLNSQAFIFYYADQAKYTQRIAPQWLIFENIMRVTMNKRKCLKGIAPLFFLLAACAAPNPSQASPSPILPSATPSVENTINGWAVLAEKDDYKNVGMHDLLVDYINITRMHHSLENLGWLPDHIHDLREFDQETLLHELNWLEKNADGNDMVILYISAHGKYLSDVLVWNDFFADEWEQIPGQRRLLVVDACEAAIFTKAAAGDPAPHLSIAAVAGNEFGWWGLEEEGLPIIGGVFTYYFSDALNDPSADTNGDFIISAQEAALMAEEKQRTYFHDVVFAVPEFVEMYHAIGVSPEKDPTFPHVILDDTIGEPLDLTLGGNH
jgi:hypothetical protein